jgi:hypothetical protein
MFNLPSIFSFLPIHPDYPLASVYVRLRELLFALVNKQSAEFSILANLIYFHRSKFIEHEKFIISLAWTLFRYMPLMMLHYHSSLHLFIFQQSQFPFISICWLTPNDKEATSKKSEWKLKMPLILLHTVPWYNFIWILNGKTFQLVNWWVNYMTASIENFCSRKTWQKAETFYILQGNWGG